MKNTVRKFLFLFPVLLIFFPLEGICQTPQERIKLWILENEEVSDSLRISVVGNGFLVFRNLKVVKEESGGLQLSLKSESEPNPGEKQVSILIWKEFFFDSKGDFVESHLRITERDCEILGKEVCDVLLNVDRSYKEKYKTIAAGTMDIVEKIDFEWIQVPTPDGHALFDMKGNFVEEMRFDR